ncbi:hypothetical protein EXU85_28925 [Spirosoma sp. KCTC 42546]|uniref:hypothetical protein n=1 Tax=Spirosoma sp. KCTC 42546 TaxID=2520506 RepID=UPI00115AD2FB|nr:hypothetical protein [Spirosoma sp. KCTC 42546]QDK82415.1 hypothetical protein EXU85_28925 [Spirosoma sp. KCTC 42546]
MKKGEISPIKAEETVHKALKFRQEALKLAAETEEFKNRSTAQLFKEINPEPSEAIKKYGNLLINMIAVKTILTGQIK